MSTDPPAASQINHSMMRQGAFTRARVGDLGLWGSSF
jgi:hypothetical protein